MGKNDSNLDWGVWGPKTVKETTESNDFFDSGVPSP